MSTATGGIGSSRHEDAPEHFPAGAGVRGGGHARPDPPRATAPHRRPPLPRAPRRAPRAAQLAALLPPHAVADRDRRAGHDRDVRGAVLRDRLSSAGGLVAQPAQRLVDLLAGAALRPLLLDLDVHLLAEDRDVPRRLDPDPDLLPRDRQDRDLDVVADHDALVGLAGENQHGHHAFPPHRMRNRLLATTALSWVRCKRAGAAASAGLAGPPRAVCRAFR